MSTLTTDLKFACRMALKTPWMTGASVMALAAAMAVTIFGFSLLWDSYFAALPFEQGDRIVAVRDIELPDPDDTPPRLAVYREWSERQRSLDVLAASYRRMRDVADGEGGLTRYPVIAMTASGFDVAGVAPLYGRTLSVADEEPGAPPVAVISYRVWRSLLGADPGAVGRTINVDGSERLIVGIMPAGFRFPISEDIWIPMSTEVEVYGGIEPRWMNVFGLLDEDTSIAQAEAELDAIRAGYAAEHPEDEDLRDRRTTVIPFVQSQTEPGTDLLFLGMFLFLLMILVVACASVSNLLLVRATARTREIAVRAALGASRGRLIAQMFIEALLLSSAAAAIGLIATHVGLNWFSTFVPLERTPFWVEFGMSPPVAAFALIAAVVAALVSGVLPARRATGIAMHDALKDEQGTTSGVRFGSISGALTVTEVALSVAFLAAAGLAAESLMVSGNIDRDLPTEQVLVASVALVDEQAVDESGEIIVPAGAIPASQWASLQQQIREAAERLPGVRQAVLATMLPGHPHGRARVEPENESAGTPSTGVRVPMSAVSPEFFAAYDSPLIMGRNFSAADTPDSEPVAIVNTSFARRFYGESNPVGERFRRLPADGERGWIRIIAVSPDLRMIPGDDNEAGFYVPFSQQQGSDFTLALRVDGDPLAMSAAVKDTIKGIDGRIDVSGFGTHAEMAEGYRTGYQVMSLMFAVLGGAAVFLAVAGLYAVMAFSVTQRTREIGIRLALGAGRGSIVGTVLRRGLLQIGVGLSLGTLSGWALLRLMQYFPTGVASSGTWMLVAASVAMLVAGLIACLVPAARAIAVHPVEALRHT
jgi:predicted permease